MKLVPLVWQYHFTWAGLWAESDVRWLFKAADFTWSSNLNIEEKSMQIDELAFGWVEKIFNNLCSIWGRVWCRSVWGSWLDLEFNSYKKRKSFARLSSVNIPSVDCGVGKVCHTNDSPDCHSFSGHWRRRLAFAEIEDERDWLWPAI